MHCGCAMALARRTFAPALATGLRYRTFGSWGVSGAGEAVGRSIEKAAENSIDKCRKDLVPELANLLTGTNGLSPQLLKGLQEMSKQAMDDAEKKLIPEAAKQVADKVIPEAQQAAISVSERIIPQVKQEFQSMLSSIRFDTPDSSDDPGKRTFNKLRESLLGQRMRYLDLQALGEGFEIIAGVTSEKDGPTHIQFTVLPCGTLIMDLSLGECFVNSKALQRVNSIHPLMCFHNPDPKMLWCRVIVPPNAVDSSAQFAILTVLTIRSAFLPVAESLTGDEELLEIKRQITSASKELLAQ